MKHRTHKLPKLKAKAAACGRRREYTYYDTVTWRGVDCKSCLKTNKKK